MLEERLTALREGWDWAERLLEALPVESEYPVEAGRALRLAGMLVRGLEWRALGQ